MEATFGHSPSTIIQSILRYDLRKHECEKNEEKAKDLFAKADAGGDLLGTAPLGLGGEKNEIRRIPLEIAV